MISQKFAPLYFPVDGPDTGAMILFRDIPPSELKIHFQKWCDIGLEKMGETRKLEHRVIRYMKTEFIGLINAVHVQAAALTSDGHDKSLNDLLDKYFEDYYDKDAESDERRIPSEFFQAFFERITAESVTSILWLLLEVVTANKDKYEYDPDLPHLLTLHERFGAVVDIAHDWKQAFAQEKRPKRTSSTNKTSRKRKRIKR